MTIKFFLQSIGHLTDTALPSLPAKDLSSTLDKGVHMKTGLFTLTLLGALASMANTGPGIICRDDRRLENGALNEIILTAGAEGYSLQSQYVPSLNSPVQVEYWATHLKCRIDQKTSVALCHNAEGNSVVSLEERRRVFFEDMEESSKKKTTKHTDISLSENGVKKKTASFSAQDCQIFGAEA